MNRVVIVSNRLPITARRGESGVKLTRSSGGLATGLAGPHQQSGGLWVGWPGDTSAFSDAEKASVARQLESARLVPVHLSAEEVEGYYEGFSNRVLWPLFHYLVRHMPLEPFQWEQYRKVNEKFADVVAPQLRPGDQVWVHDYQLCLLPQLLRDRVPDVRIGYFLHIPFPAAEVMQALPWRGQILEGILGADLVGFHTWRYQHHFADAVNRLLGLDASAERVLHGGREVRFGTYPMGIDAARFDREARRPEVLARAEQIRQESPGQRIILGIDRLDYTKGIRRRIGALERLLRREPGLRGKVKLIQVAVPSRTAIAEYTQLRQSVDETVGRVNGAFATTSWTPVHYLYRSCSFEELVALYRAADVMLVTPVRDGMNLVAKEFVACRSDEQGALLLSELAGAADELTDAFRVNPYDIEGMGDVIVRALETPPAGLQRRMGAMRERVLGWDVHRWVRAFLDELAECGERQVKAPRWSRTTELEAVLERVAAAPARVLFLDVDGTLIPFAETPEHAGPDAELQALIGALAALPATTVHLVSGRPREVLEQWFGHHEVWLHGEHGLWSREPRERRWRAAVRLEDSWKAPVREVMEALKWRTPGALVEEKTAALGWHYRRADPELGVLRAQELERRLETIAGERHLEILMGNKIVEVRPEGVHKGLVVAGAVERGGEGAFSLAIGDDRTDEDLFAAIPDPGVAIHVGPTPTHAPFKIPSVRACRALLAALVARVRGAEAEPAAPAH